MIFHIANRDKFIPAFIDLINKEFASDDHQFWVMGDVKNNQFIIADPSNVFFAKTSRLGRLHAYLYLLLMCHRANKIILHGLFHDRILHILATCPWLLRKTYWVMWGFDLYRYQKPKYGRKAKINECVRAFVIKRIGHLVTYMPGDIELAREWYGARGIYHKCQMYLSNVFDPHIMKRRDKATRPCSRINILVGNSADPSNNHIETLEKLLPFKHQDIKLYVPLSYGDQCHAKRVIRLGQEWFGDKFVPITSFMPYEQYVALLQSIDIALFNHKRQQAIGNTTQLLGLGKKVYMRPGTTQWSFYTSVGIAVFDIAQIDMSLMDGELADKNIERVSELFSEENLLIGLRRLFSEDSA